MQIIRHALGEASLSDGGRNLLDITQSEAGDSEFEALLDRLALALSPSDRPRIVLTLQEGLLGLVLSEIPSEVIVIEDDPHHEPPLRLLRRPTEADPAGLAQLLDRTERRLARSRP